MKRLLGVRIVRTEYKIVYVLAAALVAFGINTGLTYVGLPRIVGAPFAALLSLCIYLYGARVFRGRGEPIAQPRAWWRMTAERRLSALMGILFLVFSLTAVAQLGLATSNLALVESYQEASVFVAAALGQVVFWWCYLFWGVILSALYFNSAVRITTPVELPARRLV